MAQDENTEARTRPQIVREFLNGQGLQAWLAWRPDELLMMTGHMPHWGASALLYFKDQRTSSVCTGDRAARPRSGWFGGAGVSVGSAGMCGPIRHAGRSDSRGAREKKVRSPSASGRLSVRRGRRCPYKRRSTTLSLKIFRAESRGLWPNSTRRRNPRSWRSIF